MILTEAQKIKKMETTIKNSYRTYLGKVRVQRLLGRGQREAVSFEEYRQEYLDRKAVGTNTSRLASELATGGIVFSHIEASHLVNHIIDGAGSEESAISVFDQLGYTSTDEQGEFKKSIIMKQILAMTPHEAHDLVAQAIDMDVYDDGRDFEAYTY